MRNYSGLNGLSESPEQEAPETKYPTHEVLAVFECRYPNL